MNLCVCVKSARPILEATDQMLDEKRSELQDRTHDQNKTGDLANSVQHGNTEREREKECNSPTISDHKIQEL